MKNFAVTVALAGLLTACATTKSDTEAVPSDVESSGAAVVNPGVIRWVGQAVLAIIQSVKVNIDVNHDIGEGSQK